MGYSRALGLILGVALDRVVGDPKRGHPVAVFGAGAEKLECLTYRDDVAAGGAHVAACLLPLGLAGWGLERLTRSRPILHVATTALSTWAVLGAASLAREGALLAQHLDDGDLAAARERITHLCGRDPEQLDAPELARAATESMAENTADAAVASLCWGAVLGIPGLLLHRGANTLDAMIGHHNPRYERFGKVAARFDDALDLVPARLTAVLAAAVSPAVGGSAAETWRVVARDHARHPSPNGGWCESAWAGALGVKLGGTNRYYGDRVEDRPLLGDGGPANAKTVRKAARLVGLVTGAAVGVTALIALGLGRRRKS